MIALQDGGLARGSRRNNHTLPYVDIIIIIKYILLNFYYYLYDKYILQIMRGQMSFATASVEKP